MVSITFFFAGVNVPTIFSEKRIPGFRFAKADRSASKKKHDLTAIWVWNYRGHSLNNIILKENTEGENYKL